MNYIPSPLPLGSFSSILIKKGRDRDIRANEMATLGDFAAIQGVTDSLSSDQVCPIACGYIWLIVVLSLIAHA